MAKRKRARGRPKKGAKRRRSTLPSAAPADEALAQNTPVEATDAAEVANAASMPEAIEVAENAVAAALEVPAEATGSPHKERDERLPAKSTVLVRAVFDGKSRHDEVLNWSAGGDASPGGVFVHTTDLLAVGDPVVLTFDGKGAARPLSLTGRVRWVSPFGRPDDPRPGMGIAFVGASDTHRRRLSELLRPSPGDEQTGVVG